MEFFNNLNAFFTSLGDNNMHFFCYIIAGICIATYFCTWLIPVTLCNIFYEIIVLFGFRNDIWKDKMMWNTNTYLYRKIEGLYDDLGFCTKSLFYKIKLKNFNKRSNKK